MTMIKNKPFDLEAAKSGKPVQTVCGWDVKLFYFEYKPEIAKYNLLGIIKLPNGKETVTAWSSEGRWSEGYSEKDLVMAPEIREYWVNLHRNEYDCSNPITVSRVWDTQEQALSRAHVRDNSYIKTIKIHEEEI